MSKKLRPKLVITSLFLLAFTITTLLLSNSFTFFAVLQSSTTNTFGEGCYGDGCYPKPPVSPVGQGGGAGLAGKKFVPPDLELSQNLIKVELKQGETKTVELEINNTGSSHQSVSIDLQELKKFILVSEPSFKLGSYEGKTLTLDFTASRVELPDVYMGTIIVKSEYTQKKIRVVIEVIERKALFDIMVKVPEEFKQVLQGEEVEAEILMYNLGDLMPVDIVLTYSIKDFEGNIFNPKQETFAVEEQKKIRRKIEVPEDLNPDSYLFYALLEYEEQKATSSDIFQVKEKPKEKLSLWEFLKDHRLAFIVGIIGLIIVFLIVRYGIKRAKEGKKKFIIRRFLRNREKKRIERYIRQKLEEGYTEKMVMKAAKESGWEEELVKELLEEAKEKESEEK